jgi:inhibitor of KinA
VPKSSCDHTGPTPLVALDAAVEGGARARMSQRSPQRRPDAKHSPGQLALGYRMLSAGEQGLVVELGDSIDREVNARVHWLARAVASRHPREVIEIVPTYRSLLLVHDPLRVPRARLEALVRALLANIPEDMAESPARLVRVPACYGREFGPDLESVARHHGLTPEEAIAIHSGATYRVYMIGFTPGFPYLGGLPARLATPRLEVPRQLVKAGSVGIAGEQSGIYPIASPGGWRLIARTPLRLFDPSAKTPFLFTAGDCVQFEPVDPRRFEAISAAIAAGTYAPAIQEETRAGR